MSGVMGIIDLTGKSDPAQYLNAAVSRMSHFPWYRSETWVSPEGSIGLGRMSIGIFNPETQPVVNENNDIFLFMVGEFYHKGILRNKLIQLGVAPRHDNDLEFALRAFQVWGIDFVNHLNGAFVIMVYDAAHRQLILANDRFGLYPTYYAFQSGKLAFAPEVKGVLYAPFVERKLNMVAAVEYFRFQHLLGEKTFHEGIHILPYGSLGRFDLTTGHWEVTQYWDWNQIPQRQGVSLEDAVSEASRLFREATEQRSNDVLRPGVFLSGGLDSRSILGFMKPRAVPVVSATFGVQGSRDVYYAEQIARARGTQHHWFNFEDGRWILDNVDLHLKLTEGFHSWIHMHGITMLPKLREIIDYNLTGWDGGSILLSHNDNLYHDVNYQTSASHLFHDLVRTFTWPGITEAEDRMLFSPNLQKQTAGLAFYSFQEEYKRYQNFNPLNRAEFFHFSNHCFRMTLHMNTVARSHFEVRFPFFDYDLVDFVISLDLDVRKALYRQLITRETPDLARIPDDKQELIPLIDSFTSRVQAISTRIRRRFGLQPIRQTLYADYESYLRHELRPWAEAILYDRRTEERGITDSVFVRSLMERHIAGQEEWTIGKIAPLITFEMMMREYFD